MLVSLQNSNQESTLKDARPSKSSHENPNLVLVRIHSQDSDRPEDGVSISADVVEHLRGLSITQMKHPHQ